MNLENKEEFIRPLSEEEMEQAVGGAKGPALQPGEYLQCKVCGMMYDGYAGDEVPRYNGICACSRCGGALEYIDRRVSSPLRPLW